MGSATAIRFMTSQGEMKIAAGECFEVHCQDMDFGEAMKGMRALEDKMIREMMESSACSPQLLQDELVETATDILRRGGEIYWMDGDIKHVHSVQKPHYFMPFGCNGECCEQTKSIVSSDKEILLA